MIQKKSSDDDERSVAVGRKDVVVPKGQSVKVRCTSDFCGIEPCTLKPEEAETRRAPEIDSEAIKDFYNTTNSVLLGVILSIIFFLLIIVCFGIGKYMNRHKGDYYTKEDEGAHDAFDADTAVLQGRTGHQVTKKKEWFI